MNTKRKLMFSFIGLILSIAVFSTVVFAWFAKSDVSADFIVETGNLETTTKLYHAVGTNSGAEYTWNEVVTTDDAKRVFTNIVPGQVVTFFLVLHNQSTSTVTVNYNINFGGFKHLADTKSITDSEYTSYSSSTIITSANIPALFSAIAVKVQQFNVASADTRPTNQQVKDVSIYKTDTYGKDDSAKTLSEYVTSTAIAENGTLAKGAYTGYIIRFYFDPTVGTATPGKSNDFMNEAFLVNTIIASYTQKEEVIE